MRALYVYEHAFRVEGKAKLTMTG